MKDSALDRALLGHGSVGFVRVVGQVHLNQFGRPLTEFSAQGGAAITVGAMWLDSGQKAWKRPQARLDVAEDSRVR